jgi:hypothetical protein
MTKREVVWLIIRLAGLYFLWHAGESTIGFVTSVGLVTGEPRMRGDSTALLLGMLFIKACFYSVLGFYCLGNSRLLFRVLSRESTG